MPPSGQVDRPKAAKPPPAGIGSSTMPLTDITNAGPVVKKLKKNAEVTAKSSKHRGWHPAPDHPSLRRLGVVPGTRVNDLGTNAQLKELCKKLGISGYSGAKKSVLRDFISTKFSELAIQPSVLSLASWRSASARQGQQAESSASTSPKVPRVISLLTDDELDDELDDKHRSNDEEPYGTAPQPTWATAPVAMEYSDPGIDELESEAQAPPTRHTSKKVKSFRGIVRLFEDISDLGSAGGDSDSEEGEFGIAEKDDLGGSVGAAFSSDVEDGEYSIAGEEDVGGSAGTAFLSDVERSSDTPFVLDRRSIRAWEEGLTARRGCEFSPETGYTRAELLDTMGELINRAAKLNLQRPAHPLAGILKHRYEEALSLIDRRAARKDQPQHGWNAAIAERFTTDQRLSFFLAGTSDRELDALAAPDPPTREHVLAMDRELPMKGSKAIVAYRLAFVRSAEKEMVVYEGCALESNDRYERHLKAISERVNRLFYNIINRWPGNTVCAYRAFSVHVEGPQERITAMVLAARILTQYCVESIRHHWLRTFSDDAEPTSFWSEMTTRGTNGPCPSTHGLPLYSFYTDSEKRQRKKESEKRYNRKTYQKLKEQPDFSEVVKRRNDKAKVTLNALPYDDPRRVARRKKAAEKQRRLRKTWGGRTKAAGATRDLSPDHPDRLAVLEAQRSATNALRARWGGHSKAIGEKRKAAAADARDDPDFSD